MILLAWACATPNPTCEPLLQTTSTEEIGTDASGYDYCYGADQARGSFDRVSDVTCTGRIGDCSSDADCTDEQTCVCGAAVTTDGGARDTTVLSQCIADGCSEDCDGYACGLVLDVCGDPAGHYCRTGGDRCRLDSDCAEGSYCGHDGHTWNCVEASECG